ncbi:MAG: hypothetical protein ACKOWF_16590, partial [Chloroflexota bacterium]
MEREGYDGMAPAGDGEPGALREVAPGTRFDPTPYLRQLRGRGASGEYLDVKWRLLWLRTEHPDARIETEHVRIEPALAIFKATVTLPSGGVATGYGSETPGDFGDYIEKAETKAIGRALNALGYGAQFREPGDEEAGAPATPATPATPAARGRAGEGARSTARRSNSARAGSAPPPPPPPHRPMAPPAPRAAMPTSPGPRSARGSPAAASRPARSSTRCSAATPAPRARRNCVTPSPPPAADPPAAAGPMV